MKNLLGYPKMLEEAKQSKKPHSWIIELLIFVLVFIVCSRASSVPVSIGTIIWIFSDNWTAISSGIFDSSMDGILALMEAMPSWLKLVNLFSTAITTVFAILYCSKVEKRTTASMGFRKNHIGREYIIGAAIGLVMISLSAVIGLLTRSYTLQWAVPSPALLILFLLGYMVQGMSEETLVRGYLMVSMTRKTPVWVCILLSSLVFAALHLFNPGISPLAFFNLFLFGVIAAVYIVKRGSIWGACAIHTFWNYYQGCVYGISVSGSGASEGSLYSMSPAANADVLWTGGTFGIEGGLCVTIVEVIALLLVLFVLPKVKDEQLEAPEAEEAPKVEDTPKTEEAAVTEEAAKTEEAPQAQETAAAEDAPKFEETAADAEALKFEKSAAAEDSPKAEETTTVEDALKSAKAAKAEPVSATDTETGKPVGNEQAAMAENKPAEMPEKTSPEISVLPDDSTQSWS